MKIKNNFLKLKCRADLLNGYIDLFKGFFALQ